MGRGRHLRSVFVNKGFRRKIRERKIKRKIERGRETWWEAGS